MWWVLALQVMVSSPPPDDDPVIQPTSPEQQDAAFKLLYYRLWGIPDKHVLGNRCQNSLFSSCTPVIQDA